MRGGGGASLLLRCSCDAAAAPRCTAVICYQIIDITRCGRMSRGCLGLLKAFLKLPPKNIRRGKRERGHAKQGDGSCGRSFKPPDSQCRFFWGLPSRTLISRDIASGVGDGGRESLYFLYGWFTNQPSMGRCSCEHQRPQWFKG